MSRADIEFEMQRYYIREDVPVGENRPCMTELTCPHWAITA
jgi:hypothetical protein